MNYKIVKTGGKLAYLQIYAGLRQDIISGIYRYGEKLPSKRMLAEETGTSVITVEHACGLLAEEGYVEPRERSGYFVSYRESDSFPVAHGETGLQGHAPDAILREEASPAGTEDANGGAAGGKDTDSADSAASDVFPFTVFARTMRKVISTYQEEILQRSPYNGCTVLREAIVRYLARSRGIQVKADQILVGSGAEYLYGLIVQILGRNRIFGIEDPSYGKIGLVYAANGAVLEKLLLGPEGILTKALAETRASVLHVTPFNSYPSGITATASKRHEYIRFAEKRGAIIVEDDFDSEFSMSTKVEDTLFALEPKHSVIYMNTFSRTISPSVRIGYMVLPEELSDAYRKKISFYSCSVPVFDQYVLAELLQSGDFERHINRIRRKRRQEHLMKM